jgi:hypothetical protein
MRLASSLNISFLHTGHIIDSGETTMSVFLAVAFLLKSNEPI